MAMISLTGKKQFLVKSKGRILHLGFRLPPKPIPNSPSKAGFTFIELMLVAILIGVIVGISTPIFRRTFGHLQLDNTSHNLAKIMRYAQQRAIVERQPYRLKFNSSKRAYWLEVAKAEVDPLLASKGFVPIKGRFGKRYPIPRGTVVTFKEEDATAITFYPDGQVDKVTLYLSDQKANTYTLTMAGRIGYVKVVEGRQE